MLVAVGWKSSKSYFLVTVWYIRSVLVLFSKARLGVSKIPWNEWNYLYHKQNEVLSIFIYICLYINIHTYSYAIYAMIFSMLTMLLSMFDKASKILNHNGERADANNLALFFICSLFRQRIFNNHRSCVSNSRPLSLETCVTSQFWGDPWNEKLPICRVQGRKACHSQLHSYLQHVVKAQHLALKSSFCPLTTRVKMGSAGFIAVISTRSPASCHGHQPRVLNIKLRNWPRQVEEKTPATKKNRRNTRCCNEFGVLPKICFKIWQVEWLLMYVVLLSLLFLSTYYW